MKVELKGIEALEKALAEVARESTRVAITRRALRKAAEPMRAKAERYAPIDSGQLSDSIKISSRTVGEVGRAAYASVMRSGGDRSAAVSALRDARRAFRAENPAVTLYMGPNSKAWHAMFIEFGTRPHIVGGKFKGAQHPGTVPDPFMRPAFDSEARPTIERVAELIWVEIDRHAVRMARRAARG